MKKREKLEDIQHPMLEDIRAILRGERIKGYPTLDEVKEQAELHGITDIKP